MSEDTNLLFGILAVQLKFITPQDLMESAAAWAVNREIPLKNYLMERGHISEKIVDMIDGLLEEQVAAHKGDVKATLASFGGGRAVQESFAASSVLMQTSAGLESFGGSCEKPSKEIFKSAGASLSDGDEKLDNINNLTFEHPGRYTIKHEHARGGIGRVLMANDDHIGRDIAIKELLPDPSIGTSLDRQRQSEDPCSHVQISAGGPDNRDNSNTRRSSRSMKLDEDRTGPFTTQ